MKLEFKPEDFINLWPNRQLLTDVMNMVSHRANSRLAEMLKDAPVVYGHKKNFGWGFDEQGIIPNVTTHKALLINIEELPKQPCKHIPAFAMAFPNKCRECGVTLYMHWSDKPTGEPQGVCK